MTALLIPFGCIILGILFLVVAYNNDKKYKTLLKTGKEVEGVVFDMDNSDSTGIDGSDSLAYPIIRFVTHKQEWITKKADFSYSGLKPGDKLNIIYDPENPANFTIKSTIVSLMPILLMIIGTLAIIVGIVLLLFPQLLTTSRQ